MLDPPVQMTPGAILARRRETLGYPTQTDLAAAALHAPLDPHDVAPLTQSTISRFEDARTSQELALARPRTLRFLSYMLRWRAETFARNTGVTISDVPTLDVRRDPAGPRLAAARKALGKTPDDVVRSVRRRARRFDVETYHALETGVSDLAVQPLSMREALRKALYLPPHDWEVLTGLPAPGDAPTPAPPASIAGQYRKTVGELVGRIALRKANPFVIGEGTAPGMIDIPVMPLTELWPPRFPRRGDVVHTHALPAERFRPGLLLTVMPDAALLPPGPQAGELLVVDTAAETLTPGQVYVIQPGDGPLVVRRAVLDAVGDVWLLPDVLDFLSFAPVAPRTARVIGRVDWFFRPGTRNP